ncbi:MAG: aldo/keto reductase [Tepidisphaeraceae bacterium]
MKYRNLGSTGLKVSVVGVGTWQFGGEWGKDFTQEEVDRILARAADLGMNIIDTAECYGDHVSETLIGHAIHPQRDKWILATKFGHKFQDHMNRSEPRSPRDVRQQLEDSLRALKTEHIDIYQYHSWADDQFDDRAVLDVLNKQRESGRIRHIGNSVSGKNSMHQIDASRERGIEVIQIIYNRLDRRAEESAFASCTRQNLGALARVPLASGYLSGKYKPGATFPETDVRAGHSRESMDQKLAEVQRIAREEVPPGVPIATWALAWCLQHPAVASVIPGCKNVEQVEQNARAAELDLVGNDHAQACRGNDQ